VLAPLLSLSLSDTGEVVSPVSGPLVVTLVDDSAALVAAVELLALACESLIESLPVGTELVPLASVGVLLPVCGLVPVELVLSLATVPPVLSPQAATSRPPLSEPMPNQVPSRQDCILPSPFRSTAPLPGPPILYALIRGPRSTTLARAAALARPLRCSFVRLPALLWRATLSLDD